MNVGQKRVCLEFTPLLSIDYRFLSARWPRPKTLTQFLVWAYKNIDFTHLLTDLTVKKGICPFKDSFHLRVSSKTVLLRSLIFF